MKRCAYALLIYLLFAFVSFARSQPDASRNPLKADAAFSDALPLFEGTTPEAKFSKSLLELVRVGYLGCEGLSVVSGRLSSKFKDVLRVADERAVDITTRSLARSEIRHALGDGCGKSRSLAVADISITENKAVPGRFLLSLIATYRSELFSPRLLELWTIQAISPDQFEVLNRIRAPLTLSRVRDVIVKFHVFDAAPWSNIMVKLEREPMENVDLAFALIAQQSKMYANLPVDRVDRVIVASFVEPPSHGARLEFMHIYKDVRHRETSRFKDDRSIEVVNPWTFFATKSHLFARGPTEFTLLIDNVKVLSQTFESR